MTSLGLTFSNKMSLIISAAINENVMPLPPKPKENKPLGFGS